MRRRHRDPGRVRRHRLHQLRRGVCGASGGLLLATGCDVCFQSITHTTYVHFPRAVVPTPLCPGYTSRVGVCRKMPSCRRWSFRKAAVPGLSSRLFPATFGCLSLTNGGLCRLAAPSSESSCLRRPPGRSATPAAPTACPGSLERWVCATLSQHLMVLYVAVCR